MSKSGLMDLYEDYPSTFGDGLGIGDEILNICEEEKPRSRKDKTSKSKQKKKNTVPVEITGIDIGDDAEVLHERQVKKELELLEHTIPKELEEIKAYRYNNSCIEKMYQETFMESPQDPQDKPEVFKKPEGSPPATSLPVVPLSKKNRIKKNALLEGLKKNSSMKNEDLDNSCNLNASVASSSSDSSIDFHSAQMSDDYLTCSSNESKVKTKHSTSKRLSKNREFSTSFSTRKNKLPPPYEPNLTNKDFQFRPEDFPAI